MIPAEGTIMMDLVTGKKSLTGKTPVPLVRGETNPSTSSGQSTPAQSEQVAINSSG